MSNPYGVEAVTVERVNVPPIVIDGFDVILPQAPLGQFAVALNTRLVVADVRPISFVAQAADDLLVNIGGAYMGHSIKEATGNAAAECWIIDGTTAGGQLLCPITLTANESTRDWYPLPGLTVTTGLFLHVVSGSVTGAVYFGLPEGHHHHHHDRDGAGGPGVH